MFENRFILRNCVPLSFRRSCLSQINFTLGIVEMKLLLSPGIIIVLHKPFDKKKKKKSRVKAILQQLFPKQNFFTILHNKYTFHSYPYPVKIIFLSFSSCKLQQHLTLYCKSITVVFAIHFLSDVLIPLIQFLLKV